MTVRELFIETLGKRRFDKLPKHWKDWVRRKDALPKPVRPSQPSLPA